MALMSGFQAIGPSAHRAALFGRVIDGLASTPLAGAEVVITQAPAAFDPRVDALKRARPFARPERSITDGNGFFLWNDLPPGSYALRATLAGAGSRYAEAASGAVTVTVDAATSLDLTLAPTVLTGIIRGDMGPARIGSASTPAGPLALAKVRLVDSGETTFTAEDGTFTLSPVEAGTSRTIEVSAQRYMNLSHAVTLIRGQTTTATVVTLVHS